MKHFVLSFLLVAVLQFQASAQPDYAIPDDVKKIVFIGNSITYSGQYVAYIEAWFTLHHPERRFEYINVGLPSETVSGLSEAGHAGGRFPRPDLRERLGRVLTQLQPDLVFANYGMNDGIYLPFDDERFDKFKEGINWMHEVVTASGASIIHLTPPVFDERKGAAYANVLDIYSDWLVSRRYTEAWDVIDVHEAMKRYMEDRRMKDADFMFAKDGVHPNELGHWVMAREVLRYLGEEIEMESQGDANLEEVFGNHSDVLSLIVTRQRLMRDAWLSSTGHKRPGIEAGLALDIAEKQARKLDQQIRKAMN